jgi:hypothetical protein
MKRMLVALVIVVLAVVTTSCSSGPIILAGTGRVFLATVELGRPTTGAVDVEISVRRHDGPLTGGVQAVLVSTAMPDMGHVTPELPTQQVGPDRFHAHGELFLMPGTWELHIRVESTAGPDAIRIEIPVVQGGG